MQILTSINKNQTETNKISEDGSLLKEHVKDLKTEMDSLRFENEKMKRNIDNLISKYNDNDKQMGKLDSEIKNLQSTKLIAPVTTTTISNTIEETVISDEDDNTSYSSDSSTE
ncbi:unnamed protein product [Parnassius mnemosyne]|uniref:Uncharacterized protein n=1 Tax=Parnassius mnemosyne TaxID=213953 RepID=A0AAV1KJX9_9NEOP